MVTKGYGVLHTISKYYSNILHHTRDGYKKEAEQTSQLPNLDNVQKTCQQETPKRTGAIDFRLYFCDRENIDKYMDVIYYDEITRLLKDDDVLTGEKETDASIIRYTYHVICCIDQMNELCGDEENISDNLWSFLQLWRNRDGIINFQKASKFAKFYEMCSPCGNTHERQ